MDTGAPLAYRLANRFRMSPCVIRLFRAIEAHVFRALTILFAIWLVPCGGNSFGFGQELPTLRHAAEVRALAPEEAARSYPVAITATVTLLERGRTLFLQDETGGTFVRLVAGQADDLTSGTVVRVVGTTYPGLYLPGITASTIIPVGTGDLPTPINVSFDELASGFRNYEWVRLTGIVRSVESTPDQTILEIASGNGRLGLHVMTPFDADGLVDSVVEATGLAAGFINDKRQLVAPHLRLRSEADIAIKVPALTNPFGQESVPASRLLRFTPQQRPGHRIKVTGTVTMHVPGRNVYIRDGEQGLQLGTRQSSSFQPGDQIEAIGFPEIGRFSAVLQDSTIRATGQGPAPEPRDVNATSLLGGANDADLVRVEAQLLRVVPTQDEDILLMQSGKVLFQARAPTGIASSTRPGSTLRLTGICTILEAESQVRGFRSAPRSYELLIRSPADLEIMKAAPWWTARSLTYLAIALFALACVAGIWAASLRYQVRRQTALLHAKVQHEAITEERQRIAREFHDTLEQELVGLMLRLDAVGSRVPDSKPRELLAGARRLVQKLQTEVRTLVWDLRERAALRTDLVGSIEEATAAVRQDVAISVTITGNPFPLSGVVQHHLVRIAQESVTNAIKHGAARHISITVHFNPQRLRLEIIDDGTGFDVASVEQMPGHFGLLGMRERAHKCGADFHVESLRGSGCTVRVSAPVSPEAPDALQSSVGVI